MTIDCGGGRVTELGPTVPNLHVIEQQNSVPWRPARLLLPECVGERLPTVTSGYFCLRACSCLSGCPEGVCSGVMCPFEPCEADANGSAGGADECLVILETRERFCATPCQNECPPGYVCSDIDQLDSNYSAPVDGTCIDRCSNVNCGAGLVCDPLTGACGQAPCRTNDECGLNQWCGRADGDCHATGNGQTAPAAGVYPDGRVYLSEQAEREETALLADMAYASGDIQLLGCATAADLTGGAIEFSGAGALALSRGGRHADERSPSGTRRRVPPGLNLGFQVCIGSP